MSSSSVEITINFKFFDFNADLTEYSMSGIPLNILLFLLFKYLFKKVENADLKNYFPLCSASGNGHLNIVKFLILNGAHADSCNNCPLLWSAENNHINVVKYLIEKGANSSVLNYDIKKKLGIYTWSKIPEGIEIRKNNLK